MLPPKAIVKLLDYREHLRKQAEKNVVLAKAAYDSAEQRLRMSLQKRDEAIEFAHANVQTFLAAAALQGVCDAAQIAKDQAKAAWETTIACYQKADAAKSALERRIKEWRQEHEAEQLRKQAVEADDRVLTRWNAANPSSTRR